jgi:hypothetical protein
MSVEQAPAVMTDIRHPDDPTLYWFVNGDDGYWADRDYRERLVMFAA